MNDYDDAPTNYQSPPPPPPPLPNQSPSKDQKTAIAAAGVGTAALGGAAWGMSQFLSDDSAQADNNTPNDPPQPDPNGDQTTPQPDDPNAGTIQQVNNGAGTGTGDQNQLVSPKDREDMTFAEAFRDARDEMGAAHYFEWHGHLYNTYYAEEWNAMSHGEQQTFLASVPHDDFPTGGTGAMLAGGEIPAPHHGPQHHAPSHTAPVLVDDVPDPVDDADIIVEEPGPVHTAAASHTPTDGVPGQDVDVALTEVDGHAIAVFDADHDDRPDAVLFLEDQVLVMDTDHDHVLDTRTVYDQQTHTFGNEQNIEAEHVTLDGSMDVLHRAEHPSEPVMADGHPDDLHLAGHTDFDTDLGTDFDPNADVSDYV